MAVEPISARPKIVCLCGSTRFQQAFQDANRQETLAGRIVLSVGWFDQAEGPALTTEQARQLGALHLHKITLADEVLVINVNGYIGPSTRAEIEYAQQLGKPIRYWEAISSGLCI